MNKKSIKRKFANFLWPILYHTKIHLLSKIAYSGIGSILMFHRVCPENTMPRIRGNSGLEVTPAYIERLIRYFLGKGFDFISLDDVYERLLTNTPGKKFLAFTFDDGYADNFTHAFPILEKYNVPCTIYVATSYPDRKAALWWYQLEDLILENNYLKFDLGGKIYNFRSRSPEEKEETFNNIRHLLMHGQEGDHQSRINQLFSAFNVDLGRLTEKLMLSWEQITEMSKSSLVDFGAHTVNHYPLNRLSEEEIKYEILESRKRIESKIQGKVAHFSYPFGTNEEANAREFEILKECGFKTATTTRWGNIFPGHVHHFECLPRIPVNEKRDLYNINFLSLSVDGALPCLINRFKRVVTL